MYIYLFSIKQMRSEYGDTWPRDLEKYFDDKNDETYAFINESRGGCLTTFKYGRTYQIPYERQENVRWIESIMLNNVIDFLYDNNCFVRDAVDNEDSLNFIVVTIGIQEKPRWMKELMKSFPSVDISKFFSSINAVKKDCLSIMVSARDLLCNADYIQSMQDPGIPDMEFINKIEESYNYRHVYIIKDGLDKPFTVADTINYTAYQIMNLIKKGNSLARFVDNEGEKIRLLEGGTIMIEK